jgi:hypothetical protein
MADTNAQMEELAKILERVNYDMDMFGKLTKETADAKFDADVKAKTGLNNATKGMTALGDGLAAVAGSAFSAGKAMADGKKGAAAFNESVDGMAKAAAAAGAVLTLMIPGGPLIKLFFAGVTAAIGAVAAYTKASNTMADQLYKTYSGLSKAGGSASDGMSGVLKASNQLGLSMEEMDGFVGQIAANSKDLALFSGSVFEGRQKIGDMGEALKGSREDFLKMGMSMTDVSDGMLGYLKIQTRLGNSQNKTTAELAEGAKKYLVEQDALSKLTGQTRKEMEDQRERALQGEQFAAKIRQLQLEGEAGKKAAEELLKMNAIYEAAGPKMAAAFQATVTGNLSNADAQAANLASNGAMMETTQKVIAGQMSYTDAVTVTGKAMGQTADTVGVVLGQFGAYNESFGPINEQLKLAQLAQGDITTNMAKIKEDQKKILEGGVDPMLAKQALLIKTQIDANEAFKIFISNGIDPAQDAMIALANATVKAGNFLGEMTGSKGLIQRTVDMFNAKDSKELAKVGGNETFGELAGGAGGGIAAGMIAGGLVGSIVPVVGTAIGAAIGGALGAWGGSKIGGTIGKYVDDTTKEEADKSKGKPIEKRAGGGPVDAKTPYLIGENGPELFIPSAGGDVMSNANMKALGNAPSTMPMSMPLPAPMGKTPSEMPSTDMFKDTKHLFDEILSTANVASKSMTTGYGKLDDSFDKILSTANVASKSMAAGHGDLDNSFDKILSTVNVSSESMASGYGDLDNSFDKILSTLDVVSKSMTTGYRELDNSFNEITKDSLKIEKLSDSDTKRAEKYSIAYKSYVDLKTQLMDLETPDLKTQIDLLQQKALQSSTATAGATSSQQDTPATTGSGLKMPTTNNMPSMGGGQGVKGGVASQSDLTKMGLKLKTGDVQAEGSKIDPKIIDLAQQVQSNMPNFSYFSGFNDKFHQEKSPSSSHTTGRAMDFALSKEPSKEEGQEIVKWLKGMGASVAIDEYNNPSSKSTAGHIHAQIAGYADGGVASSPQIAMVAEKGPEAMIPLVNGAIPINLNLGPSPEDDRMSKIFEAGFGELSTQFAKLTDIDLIKSTIADFKNGQFGLKDAQELLKSNSTEAKTALDDGAQKYERMLADALEKQSVQQAEMSSRMIDALAEMIRTQKDSNSIQERILQTSM